MKEFIRFLGEWGSRHIEGVINQWFVLSVIEVLNWVGIADIILTYFEIMSIYDWL